MKINITKKEYRLLLEMLHLSDWMMHSHLEGPEQRHAQHEELRKKLLSYYKEMEAEDIIEYSKESNDYYETNEYEEYLHEKFITPYDHQSFWDELIDRLAERDVIKEMGSEKFKSMDGMERITKLANAEEKYVNEFENHGLEHVKIDYKTVTKS